ncbi:hypothetical protein [Actinacidiphila acididurans]|uniref:Helix-turn-helix domain-containing protein n=1 Tax=Actinacidiphila acididurans TaxID=2784346 RepID=A0ABS2U371_9ACTN|nr:hypothetical protein [Actinacidiphila acididurans]MBM9510060.1 hypothetical protein [Actinacidiphila acididurans]
MSKVTTARTSAPSGCAEGGSYCGTPTGWRRGGRCVRCRIAHNAEAGRYRGLTEDERTTFLAALNAGRTADAAAAHAGVSLKKLAAASILDGELRAALDGMPPEVQKAARMGEYLAALTRTGGSAQLALTITGLTSNRLADYRQQEPGFAAAEEAVMAWLRATKAAAVRKLSETRLDEAASVLEGGGSVTEAAEAIHTSATALRYAARRHPRLAAALPPKTNAGPKSSLTPDREKVIRELWGDLSIPMATIGKRLGVAGHTISRWGKELGLPPRRATALAGHRLPLPRNEE